MKGNELTPESKLMEVREALAQVRVQLQILGRALTPAEEARVLALGRAVELIDEALEVLSQEYPDI